MVGQDPAEGAIGGGRMIPPDAPHCRDPTFPTADTDGKSWDGPAAVTMILMLEGYEPRFMHGKEWINFQLTCSRASCTPGSSV